MATADSKPELSCGVSKKEREGYNRIYLRQKGWVQRTITNGWTQGGGSNMKGGEISTLTGEFIPAHSDNILQIVQNKSYRILVLGLAGSGKTSLCQALHTYATISAMHPTPLAVQQALEVYGDSIPSPPPTHGVHCLETKLNGHPAVFIDTSQSIIDQPGMLNDIIPLCNRVVFCIDSTQPVDSPYYPHSTHMLATFISTLQTFNNNLIVNSINNSSLNNRHRKNPPITIVLTKQDRDDVLDRSEYLPTSRIGHLFHSLHMSIFYTCISSCMQPLPVHKFLQGQADKAEKNSNNNSVNTNNMNLNNQNNPQTNNNPNTVSTNIIINPTNSHSSKNRTLPLQTHHNSNNNLTIYTGSMSTLDPALSLNPNLTNSINNDTGNSIQLNTNPNNPTSTTTTNPNTGPAINILYKHHLDSLLLTLTAPASKTRYSRSTPTHTRTNTRTHTNKDKSFIVHNTMTTHSVNQTVNTGGVFIHHNEPSISSNNSDSYEESVSISEPRKPSRKSKGGKKK